MNAISAENPPNTPPPPPPPQQPTTLKAYKGDAGGREGYGSFLKERTKELSD